MLQRWALALVAVAALTFHQAHADEVAAFYKDRKVYLVVGFGNGSGYDVYGRLLARFLTRHIPGNPEVLVQNMPGAASLRATNYLYNDAPNDGTVIGTFTRDMAAVGIAGKNPLARFNIRAFTWLGSSSSYADDAYLLFVRKDAPVRSLAAARNPWGRPLYLADSAEGATFHDMGRLARSALGLNVRIISTYPDRHAPYYAAMRREVDGRFASLSMTAFWQPKWLDPGGEMAVLLQFGRDSRHKDLPNVPTARELAPDDRARSLIAMAELPYRLSRPFVAPAGVPRDRAQALQAAFLAVHRDPDYLAEAARLKLDVSPVGAAEALRILDAMAEAPAEARAHLQELEAQGPGRGHGRGWSAHRAAP